MKLQIYTDGSCRANGQGGIGIVWVSDNKVIQEYSKGFKDTTNNQMELFAIKIALLSIKKPLESVEIITDSEYCIGVLTNPKWNPKKNVKLIHSIQDLIKEKEKLTPIIFTHVKGHSSNTMNNRCDSLAQEASSMLML